MLNLAKMYLSVYLLNIVVDLETKAQFIQTSFLLDILFVDLFSCESITMGGLV